MGSDDREVVFAGAGARGMGTPWGTLGEITAKALEPLGFAVHLEGRSYGVNNTRFVADGRADLGATHLTRVLGAYHGKWEYAGEPPRSHLRVIAAIHHPSWIGVAVNADAGITDLMEIRERHLPVRVKGGAGPMFDIIYEHYGISRELIESWGGMFHDFELASGLLPWVRAGEFDLIIDTLYAAYTPEARHWWEASVLYELRFLPLPEDLVRRICDEVGGEPGAVPRHLVRGVDLEVPSVARLPQVIYAREDLPEEIAYMVAKALDDNRQLFRATHLPFSYDPRTVADAHGAPLHHGAAHYYGEVGYLRT
jgi:uncharacterized protein